MNGLLISMTATNDEERWAAVAARDATADGRFVYAVRTTGVYCRPACPSRRPRRENVAFFPAPDRAEAAGFRACRRCAPAAATSPAAKRTAAVEAACRLIADHETAPSLAELAASSGLSRFHFHRLFVETTGVTPRAYAAAVRAERVRAALTGAPRVADAAYDAGYGSASTFYDAAPAALGMSPRAFRRGGAGETIGYATAPTPLGRALVAATERGICAIAFGDDDDALARELAGRFPRATLTRDDARVAPLLDAVAGALREPARAHALPLDVRGTAFQRRVWEALRAIPAGATRTYAEIARDLGVPGAQRAVAGACAANPVAVAIPCHRVQRIDGGLGGYRWGIARKRALLDAERR